MRMPITGGNTDKRKPESEDCNRERQQVRDQAKHLRNLAKQHLSFGLKSVLLQAFGFWAPKPAFLQTRSQLRRKSGLLKHLRRAKGRAENLANNTLLARQPFLPDNGSWRC
jgi:hypothetical protein